MKKISAIAVSGFIVCVAVFVSQAARPSTADEAARTAVLKLYGSLNDEQKKLALKELTDKDRYTEQFPAVERKGLPYDKLTKEQKVLADDVLKAITSDYGAKRCLDVAKQTPENRRYVNFFGEPGGENPFIYRVASHHLTLLHAEFGDPKTNEFGPILLGANPAKDLWSEEEKIAIELYKSLTPDEVKNTQGKGSSSTSGAAIGKVGVKIADLNEKSRGLARQLLAKRLEVVSADRRKVAEALINKDGGVDSLRVAFWNAADKSHLDGGNYHWRIGNDTFVADWQTAGKNHIHMTLRARAKKG